MKTIDGGTTWQKVQSLDSYGILLQSIKIYFSKPNVGFILGKFIVQSVILKNFGGGDYWTIQKYVNYRFTDVHFLDENRGFLLGFSNDIECTHCYREGTISYTSNGGTSWEIKFNTPGILTACLFVNELTGIVFSNRMIFKSTDAGNIWMKLWENNADSMGYAFSQSDIYFKDEEKGWIVGGYFSEFNGAGILKTTSKGEKWDLAWQLPDTSNYHYSLKSVHFTETSGWSAGDGGLIVKYTPQNGWVKQTSITDLPLNKVFFSDDNNGWIAGGYQNNTGFQAILLKTTDGGTNWNAVPNVPYLIRDVAFINNNLGWAIGYDSSGVGGILKSTDGGNTWTIDIGNLPAKLNALHIKDNYGWAVGDNGLILRTTNAGPTWVENNNQTLPTEFVLEQNYPNPFNPTTKIKYEIPASPNPSEGGALVQLKVYDILGREVATLVNKEQKPRVYEVDFSATYFSSGIYLYRLQSGDFNAVKKMILLK
jgi:photosystem II stability/assembly factor-like uncharacterized protein